MELNFTPFISKISPFIVCKYCIFHRKKKMQSHEKYFIFPAPVLPTHFPLFVQCPLPPLGIEVCVLSAKANQPLYNPFHLLRRLAFAVVSSCSPLTSFYWLVAISMQWCLRNGCINIFTDSTSSSCYCSVLANSSTRLPLLTVSAPSVTFSHNPAQCGFYFLLPLLPSSLPSLTSSCQGFISIF